ncbi:MAG: alkaline phosphatase [Fibromonadales bacterium]|nr:alkaline phosphatase [Fibromonadales bacterium]
MPEKIKFYAFIAIAAAMTACSGESAAAEPVAYPQKYIFLFIGDGMSPSHVSVAQAKSVNLSFTTFPVKGALKTRSADNETTCSAAAATALATGTKTNNGRVAIDTKGKPLRSIAYDFKDAGCGVGIATTVSIDHATPAAFYAKDYSRDNYYSIATQLAPSGFNFFAGEEFLDPREDAYAKTSQAGYIIVQAKEELAQVLPSQKILMRQSENADTWSLADFTSIGIERLSHSKGFFFMIEGGKIDKYSHDNNGDGVVKEMDGFSKAVAVALDFYKKYPDETLIVVTADHGTGGIGLKSNGEFTWTTDGHTKGDVPVYAIGLSSDFFAGTMDNTDIPKKISKFLTCQ